MINSVIKGLSFLYHLHVYRMAAVTPNISSLEKYIPSKKKQNRAK